MHIVEIINLSYYFSWLVYKEKNVEFKEKIPKQ